MYNFWRSLSEETLAGLIGTLLGFMAKTGVDLLRKERSSRTLLRVLGFPSGDILIIHSALFDPGRSAYNYPSCDMLASRRVANVLEIMGKKEGRDFRILPESGCLTARGEIKPEVLNSNLILLGGPKRNKITALALDRSAKLRYDMRLLPNGENRLYDNVARHELVASRDNPTHEQTIDSNDTTVGYDYGLLMSAPNPLHLDRGMFIIAGIHGPGTAGAATFLSNRARVFELSRKRKGGIIQEVVAVEYEVESERIIEVTLV